MTAPPEPHLDRSVARRQVNAELADRALAKASGVAMHRPVHVYLQVASACNLDCYMCSEHNRPESERHGRGLRAMSPEIFAKVEKEIFPWSSRTYIGVGGEPTIAPGFADFVRRAARAGQEIHLITNATRFGHGEIAEVVARDVAQLFVSLDAATAPTYERIRRGAHWNSTLHGMRRLRELRERADNGGCRLTLSFVLMRSNVHELPLFVELAHELGASVVHAQHVIPVNEEGRVESLFDEMDLYAEMRARAQQRADELGILLDAPHPFARASSAEAPTLEPTQNARASEPATAPASSPALPRSGPAVPCILPATSLVVLYDGRVFPCCHPFAHAKMRLGDLRTQSVAEIWNDRQMRNLRAGLRNGDVPEICRNCSSAHDPPPGREDPSLLAASLDLAAYYGERDLAPLDLASKNAASRAHELIDGTGVSSYVEDLREHSNLLALERDRLREHAATLQHERVHQLGHIANLEDARGHLVAHVANLESEHAHVAGHAANLERELAELRTHRTLRQLLILRVRRMLGMSAVPRAATVAHRAAASPIASEERGA